MVSGTDHQHRYRHLRTEEGRHVRGETIATSGKVDVFYCEVCLVYRQVPEEAAEQPSQPFGWMEKPDR